MLQAPLYFEDVEVGYKFQSPGGRTITNAEVVNFAQITGDYNLVHLDHEFAKTGMYGENIAHGALTLGDLTGFKHVKFMAPVKFNSTIHLECEITDKTDNGDGTGTIELAVHGIDQDGTLVLDNVRYYNIAKKN